MRADQAQVRAMVAAYAPGEDGGRALALCADAEWAGPENLDVGSRSVRVKACAAPLAVREALLDHDAKDRLLVLLTPCSSSDLGLDVRLRLVKGDVLPLDPFVSVLALFGASVLDPELAHQRWLIDDLIALAPATGWAERLPLGGLLDVDVAWRAWHAARLGFDSEPADLAGVVGLAERTEVCARVAELSAGTRKELGARWARLVGDAAPVLVDLMASGQGPNLIALGLVAEVLWAVSDRPGASTVQSLARARLEGIFGRDRMSSRAASEWATAASSLFAFSSRQAVIIDTAELFLSQADAIDLAFSSAILPRGFELRLAAVAEALKKGDAEEAAARLQFARRHRLAGRRDHRLAAAEAAVALVRRRSSRDAPSVTAFGGAAAAYAAEGAFLDEAVRLLSEGDTLPELAQAYASLAAQAESARAPSMAAFARLLVDWSRSEPVPDARIVPLERLLAEIVAPIARDAPVLLVVCDGMSLPVAHELARDLLEENWAPAAPEGRGPWPVGVALLPTVTEASRASLLSGRGVVGGQSVEKEGFSTNRALGAVSGPTRPPVLFHKAELVGPSGTALPTHVRELVADPDQRVVGVVVNAIDDQLGRGEQVRLGWGLSSLRPLGWLLDAAIEAGRVLVLTADHGHVLHGPISALRALPGGGERRRTAPPAPEEGEVEVAGPRVLLGQGKVVLPTDDRRRYGGHKYGYHGGATAEEVLVPVEVLARRLPTGWRHRPAEAPAWWKGEKETVPTPSPALVAPVGVVFQPTTGQGSFFGTNTGAQTGSAAGQPAPTHVVPGTWVDDLLASPVFTENRQRMRLPRPLADSALRSYLAAIDANGGSIPLAALSARTGEPPDTLRMALSFVQRLLNMDGTEVLAVRGDGTVVLNRELASLQFELGPR
jgi:hypothetical protein